MLNKAYRPQVAYLVGSKSVLGRLFTLFPLYKRKLELQPCKALFKQIH